MADVNVEQVLNSSLPNVYIERVTFENKGGVVRNKIDPHIDYDVIIDREGNRRLSTVADVGFRQLVSTEGETTKNSDSQDMTVTVTFAVKDAVTSNLLGYWFKNRDITKLLKIRYTHITNPKYTSHILNNDPTLSETTKKWKIQEVMLNDALERNSIDTKLTRAKTQLPADVASAVARVDKNRHKNVNNDGDEIHTYTFQQDFIIPNSTQYLAILACCRIDLDSLFGEAAGTLQVNSDIINALDPDLLAGRLAYNILLENGNVSSIIPIFVDEETGKVWDGPVHQVEDGRWLTGATPSPDSKFLTRREIPNTRVQDFRISSYIDKRILEIHNTEKEIIGSFVKNVTNNISGINKPKTYFSDIEFATDELGQARFFFTMDYHRILEDNTAFGALLRKKNLVSANEIASLCKIVSFKIFRTRIKGSPETGSKPYEVVTGINAASKVSFNPIIPKNFSVFDCNQADQLIISTSERGQVIPKSEHSKVGPIEPVKVMSSRGVPLGDISPDSPLVQTTGFVEFTKLVQTKTIIGTVEEILNLKLDNSDGVRIFSGIDKSMSDVTDGYYQYRLELEILDRSAEFILGYLKSLTWAKKVMKEYLYKVLEPSGQSKPKLPDVAEAIDIYLRTLLIFTNETNEAKFDSGNPKEFNTLRTQLIAWCNPDTPNGVSKILSMMELLISKLGDIGNISKFDSLTKTENSTQSARVASSLTNYSKPKITFFIENTFSAYFNSNLDKRTSYDFMGLDMRTDHGIKDISDSEFRLRMQKETEKLSNNIDDNLEFEVDGNIFNNGDSFKFTDFSYIAPAQINMPNMAPLQLIGSSPLPPIANNQLLAFNFANRGFINPSIANSPLLQRPQNQRLTAFQTDPTVSTYANSVIGKMESFGMTIQPMYVAQIFQANITDPVEKDETNCNTPSNSSVSADPLPVFNRILEEIDPDSYQSGGPYASTGQARQNEKNAEFARVVRSIGPFYSPNRRGGPVSNFIQNFSRWTPNQLFRGRSHRRNLSPRQGWIATTPNHIKSMVRFDTLPANIQTMTTKAKHDIGAQTELDLKFLKLNVIEVMIGYNTPNIMGVDVRDSLWEPLTRETYNDAINQKLLCRMKPYENREFGITRKPKDNFVTLDEYFILNPKEVTLPPLNVIPSPPKTTTIRLESTRPMRPDEKDLRGLTGDLFGVIPDLENLFSTPDISLTNFATVPLSAVTPSGAPGTLGNFARIRSSFRIKTKTQQAQQLKNIVGGNVGGGSY